MIKKFIDRLLGGSGGGKKPKFGKRREIPRAEHGIKPGVGSREDLLGLGFHDPHRQQQPRRQRDTQRRHDRRQRVLAKGAIDEVKDHGRKSQRPKVQSPNQRLRPCWPALA